MVQPAVQPPVQRLSYLVRCDRTLLVAVYIGNLLRHFGCCPLRCYFNRTKRSVCRCICRKHADGSVSSARGNHSACCYFVLIVSRIESESALSEALIRAGKQAKTAEFRPKRRSRNLPLVRIFKFRDFEDVCRGVEEIYEIYMGSSRLFKYQGEFFLEMCPVDTFGFFEVENILSEFSEKSKQPLSLQGVLNEHGRLMIEKSAVSIIAENFVGLDN